MMGSVGGGPAQTSLTDIVSLIRIIQNPDESAKLLTELNQACDKNNEQLVEINKRELRVSQRELEAEIKEQTLSNREQVWAENDKSLVQRVANCNAAQETLDRVAQGLDNRDKDLAKRELDNRKRTAEIQLSKELNDLAIRNKTKALDETQELLNDKLRKLKELL